MKKVLSVLLVGAFIFASYANGGLGETPKVQNYHEVISKIEYPQVCREKGIEGTVVVALDIDEKGAIVGHEFLHAPCSDLQEAVEAALGELTFTPAKNNQGEAISGKITMPVSFKLTI